MQKTFLPVHEDVKLREGDLLPLPTWDPNFLFKCFSRLQLEPEQVIDIDTLCKKFEPMFRIASLERDRERMMGLLESKLGLQQQLINFQCHTNHNFIAIPSRGIFPCVCPICKGTGEKYYIGRTFFRDQLCNICDGKGHKDEICQNCNGTGENTISKEDGTIETIKCASCDGTGNKKDVPCIVCQGKGTRHLIKMVGPIISRTPCKPCNSFGHYVMTVSPSSHEIFKKNKSVFKPVIDEQAAQMIQQQLSQ